MQASVVIKRFLGLPAATKSQTGFLIALVGLITIGARVAIVHFDVLNRNEAVVCVAVGLIGFVCWPSGRLGEDKRAQPRQGRDTTVDNAAAEDPLAFFKCPQSWGVILVLSAAQLSCLADARCVAGSARMKTRRRNSCAAVGMSVPDLLICSRVRTLGVMGASKATPKRRTSRDLAPAK
jgi:hypothetical protein